MSSPLQTPQPWLVPESLVYASDLFHDAELIKDARARIADLLHSADVDPGRFPDPETYDIAREDKAHLVFNAGPHRCMGLPHFRIDPERPPTFHGGHNIGIQKLHLGRDTEVKA